MYRTEDVIRLLKARRWSARYGRPTQTATAVALELLWKHPSPRSVYVRGRTGTYVFHYAGGANQPSWEVHVGPASYVRPSPKVGRSAEREQLCLVTNRDDAWEWPDSALAFECTCSVDRIGEIDADLGLGVFGPVDAPFVTELSDAVELGATEPSEVEI